MKASLPYFRRLIVCLLLSLISSLATGSRPLRAQPPPGVPPGVTLKPVNPILVQNGPGELEIAASDDGQHVIIAANSGYSFSNDGGQTFTFGSRIAGPGGVCIYQRCDGDPSIAVGKTGAFYFSWIGRQTSEPSGIPDGWASGVSRSADGGQTFTFQSNAVFCPLT